MTNTTENVTAAAAVANAATLMATTTTNTSATAATTAASSSSTSPITAAAATTTPIITVAVIGCGPGGMFFCHALETRRRQLLQQIHSSSDPSSSSSLQQLLSELPLVTCFERASSPGGVWRAKRQHYNGNSDDNNDDSNNNPAVSNNNDNNIDNAKKMTTHEQDDSTTTNMYEALWTNGPKEGIEFFDYTYDDHFQRPLPVFMPRQAVLEYMTARVTHHCPTFFETYVQFQTSVESVTYCPEKSKKFRILTRHVVTGTTTVHEFDKCIWAAGDNGKPKMPKDLVHMLHDGGFQGRIMHSSDAAAQHDFFNNVHNKRVLMIGGSYSAEDLALMAIKLGVAKLMITCRSDDPPVAWTGAWPNNKVKIYTQRVPVSVHDHGRSIQLAAVDYTWPNQYQTRRRGKKAEKLRDIDTIIFCTGYEKNMSMLDESLQRPFTNAYNVRFTAFPENWKMADNVLSDVVAEHVEPGDVRYRLGCVIPGLYRGVLIDNPSMMYLLSEFSEFPLLAADVNAWMLFGFITGTTPLPTRQEMTKRNDQQALTELNMPYLRYWMDRNYRNKVGNLEHFWGETDDDDDDARWYVGQAQYDVYELRRLGQFMKEAKYPLNLLKDQQQEQQQEGEEDGEQQLLNDKGNALYQFNNAVYYLRANLAEDKEQGWWKTFRDCDAEAAQQFYSIHTGTRAIPLKARWLDLDDHDPNLI